MSIRLIPLSSNDRSVSEVQVPTLVLPIEQGVVEVSAGSEGWLLDRSSWLLLAPGSKVVVSAKSPTASVLCLGLHPEVRAATAQLHRAHLRAELLESFLFETTPLARTTWVHEIAHRYLFERSVCGDRQGLAARFLESELVKELYFHCLDRAQSRQRASTVRQKDPIVERALAVLEAHLFEPISIAELARACSISPSTLQRAFHRDLGAPPSRYLRQRRLQESILLLKSGRYSVSEVAALVGYDNLAAFSHAFRARFGKSPSEIRRAAGPSHA